MPSTYAKLSEPKGVDDDWSRLKCKKNYAVLRKQQLPGGSSQRPDASIFARLFFNGEDLLGEGLVDLIGVDMEDVIWLPLTSEAFVGLDFPDFSAAIRLANAFSVGLSTSSWVLG
jgi:hypothetical protein